MALTPFLNEVGRKAAEVIDSRFKANEKIPELRNFDASEPVVILGFGQMGQVLANLLSTPLAAGLNGDLAGWPIVAFDLDPGVIKAAQNLGFPVLYGDGSRPIVLQTAGISLPKAVMVMYTGKKKTVQAVERLRLAFPSVPIYARAQDLGHLLELKKAGATDAILENAETSLQLGSKLLRGLGVMSDDVSFISQLMRDSMEIQALEALEKKDVKEADVMKSLQVKVTDSLNVPMEKIQETQDTIFERESIIQESPPQVRSLEEIGSKSGEDKFDHLAERNMKYASPPNISDPLIGTHQGASVLSSTPVDSELEVPADIYSEASNKLSGRHSASEYDNCNSKPHSEYQTSSDSIQNVNDEDHEKGVTYCALTVEDGFPRETEEGEKEDQLDESMACASSGEGS